MRVWSKSVSNNESEAKFGSACEWGAKVNRRMLFRLPARSERNASLFPGEWKFQAERKKSAAGAHKLESMDYALRASSPQRDVFQPHSTSTLSEFGIRIQFRSSWQGISNSIEFV